jgi:hypothetical protein
MTVSRNTLQEGDENKTFSSYLSGYNKKTWCPEKPLLLVERGSGLDEGDKEIGYLLERWGEVAMRLEHPGRSAAAEFQGVVYEAPEKWNAVLAAYRRLSVSDAERTIAPLFVQWKNEMAARSLPYFMHPDKIKDTWIHWLIDAKLDVKNKKRWFLNKLAEWLSHLKGDTRASKKLWHWLVPLTEDLPESKKIAKKYPIFWETVLQESNPKGDLTVSRRDALREMNSAPCLNIVLEVWQRQLRHIVPDPVDARKSNYEYHAQWAQALFELDKNEYRALIARWRKKHDRRRNLWRDLKARHLPVG